MGRTYILSLVISVASSSLWQWEFVAIYHGVGVPLTELQPHHDQTTAAKYFTIASIVYILATAISKIGVGLVLYRLSSGADMRFLRITLIVSMGTMRILSLAIATTFGLQCRPLNVAWGEGRGTGMPPNTIGKAGIALSAVDVAVSCLLAILPVFMLWKAQLKLGIKATIMILLGLGAASSVATIGQLKYVIEVAALTGKGGCIAAAETLQITLETTVYSILEINMSMFAATLTAVRLLIKRIPCFSDFSSGGGRTPSNDHRGSSPSSNDIQGPSYRLYDVPPSDGGSEKGIIAPRRLTISKSSKVKVEYHKSARHYQRLLRERSSSEVRLELCQSVRAGYLRQ